VVVKYFVKFFKYFLKLFFGKGIDKLQNCDILSLNFFCQNLVKFLKIFFCEVYKQSGPVQRASLCINKRLHKVININN
jgi:hypothetical protein